MTGTNLDVVQEPRVRVKYAGHESVNVSSIYVFRFNAVIYILLFCFYIMIEEIEDSGFALKKIILKEDFCKK